MDIAKLLSVDDDDNPNPNQVPSLPPRKDKDQTVEKPATLLSLEYEKGIKLKK